MFQNKTAVRFTVSIVVLSLIIFSLSSFIPSAEGSLADSSWPKFRGNLRNTGRNEITTHESIDNISWTFETEDRIDSSPVIGPDGTIYVGSYDGNLYAIGNNGEMRWKFETSSIISSTPGIAEDGSVYFGTADGRLFSVDQNGDENWVLEEPFEDSIFSSPVITEDGSILVGSSELYSIHPNGTIQWSFSSQPGGIISTPAVDEEGRIYVGYQVSLEGFVLGGQMLALNSDGELLWEFNIIERGAQILSSPAISEDGNIYFGSNNNNLYALDRDGNELWNYSTDGNVFSSPAIGEDGTIYVGSADSNLYAINPNGTEKWHFETGGDVPSSPAIGPEGMIYFGSYDNSTYSLYPNGTERWRVETGDRIFSSPALGPDGSLYIGSLDNNLYAFGRERMDREILYRLHLPLVLGIIIFVLVFIAPIQQTKKYDR